MVNQIEALKLAMEINQQTLEIIAERLKKNPCDSRSLAARKSSLGLLEEWINEAEQVYQDNVVANFGKEQHNKYSASPKYEIRSLSVNPSKCLERVVLVVDDQYGQSDDPMIPTRFGDGKVAGYRFELEDARIGNVYDSKKVVKRISAGKIDGILLDMDFGRDQRGYGEKILEEIKGVYPTLPVFIFSSTDDSALIQRCFEKGANGRITKVPSSNDMKIHLDSYFLELNKAEGEK
jgi:CheY-like chemotaxis protein